MDETRPSYRHTHSINTPFPIKKLSTIPSLFIIDMTLLCSYLTYNRYEAMDETRPSYQHTLYQHTLPYQETVYHSLTLYQ